MRRAAGIALAAALLLVLPAAGSGGPHLLTAKGNQGWIKVWGDGTIDLSGRGTLTVKNESNLQVKLDGTWKERTPIQDGAVYVGFNGSVHSIGLGAHFELRGWDLVLHMKGQGKAHFQGFGTTVLDGGAERAWPNEQTHNGWLKIKFRD